ncbi:hypothetical protein FJZ53_01595 [Candidatus Woesearchaeota archaeon]|nr:hypothetical protein [Candidatus Woesearchaeota archaeon]
MDKEQATRILSKELVKAKGQKFIVNNAYQKHLLEKAISLYEVEYEKPLSMRSYIGDVNNLSDNDLAQFIQGYKSKITDYCSGVGDANYVFTERLEDLSQTRSQYGTLYSYFIFTSTFSFFSLIGEKEAEDLKHLFYKDVSAEVVQAMDVLKIEHFIYDYQRYKNLDGSFLEKLDSLTMAKKFINYVPTARFDKDGEMPIERLKEKVGSISDINKHLKQLGLSSIISDRDYRKISLDGYIHKDSLFKAIDELKGVEHVDKIKNLKTVDEYYNDFFNFVFSLPYEDQNIEMNKFIIKCGPVSFDYAQIMLKEYSDGKYFQEYFDCLDAEKQKKVVGALKSVSKKNSGHNAFLWGKGFKDVDIDYMLLYKVDYAGFMDYFGGRTAEEKRVILKDVMDSDFVNEKVIAWLNDNYLDLIREVGFNG